MLKHSHPNLGRLVQPRHYSSVEATASAGIPWAADNDAFGGWTEARENAWVTMLGRLEGLPGCRFVTCPDVVADAAGTARLFDRWEPEVRRRGLPVGLVAQDGARDLPWDRLDALFLGGSTEFKLGHAAEVLAREARARGKWVHMGRVNSAQRIAYAKSIGCDSVDGQSWAKWKDRWLDWGLGLCAVEQQTRLELDVG